MKLKTFRQKGSLLERFCVISIIVSRKVYTVIHRNETNVIYIYLTIAHQVLHEIEDISLESGTMIAIFVRSFLFTIGKSGKLWTELTQLYIYVFDNRRQLPDKNGIFSQKGHCDGVLKFSRF